MRVLQRSHHRHFGSAKAREKARQSSCLSNLKQINLGVLSYAQDNDERMPLSCGYTSSALVLAGPEWPNYWWEAVMPYMKNTQILACPSSSVKSVTSGNVTDTRYVVNYAYNIKASGQSLGTCQYPTETGLNIDSNNNYWRLAATTPVVETAYVGVSKIHNDGFNANFVDGHAKWINGAPFSTAASTEIPGTLRSAW